jgi:hypothetical protein
MFPILLLSASIHIPYAGPCSPAAVKAAAYLDHLNVDGAHDDESDVPAEYGEVLDVKRSAFRDVGDVVTATYEVRIGNPEAFRVYSVDIYSGDIQFCRIERVRKL